MVIRKRFRDAAEGKDSPGGDGAREAGLARSEAKSSTDSRREREVQELLDNRPRALEGENFRGSGELHRRHVSSSDEPLSPTAVEQE